MCIPMSFIESLGATYQSNGDFEYYDDLMFPYFKYAKIQGYQGFEFGMTTEDRITVFFHYRRVGDIDHYRELAVLESTGVQIAYKYTKEGGQ